MEFFGFGMIQDFVPNADKQVAWNLPEIDVFLTVFFEWAEIRAGPNELVDLRRDRVTLIPIKQSKIAF